MFAAIACPANASDAKSVVTMTSRFTEPPLTVEYGGSEYGGRLDYTTCARRLHGRRVGPRLSPRAGAATTIRRHGATVLLVDDTVLVAPAAGTVSAVNGAVGEAVASGRGQGSGLGRGEIAGIGGEQAGLRRVNQARQFFERGVLGGGRRGGKLERRGAGALRKGGDELDQIGGHGTPQGVSTK